MKTDLKVAKWIGYITIMIGILRLIEYCLHGNAHHQYALALSLHLLIAGPIIVWLSIWISKKENKTLNS